MIREMEKENASGNMDTRGTEKFVTGIQYEEFVQWKSCKFLHENVFDMLNTRSLTEGRQLREKTCHITAPVTRDLR